MMQAFGNDNREYLNELAADIASAWDLHIKYSNNELMVQTSGDDGEAVCYLCLDGGLDDAGQSLQRDCACRGTDAGYVHLSCLTGYAETKGIRAHGMNLNMKEFVNPWIYCPNCHQDYQNYFAVDIATKFVSFVRRQYPEDTPKQVESLHLKLCTLMDVFDRVPPVQKREAGVTANVLLSLIDRMRVDAPLTKRYSQFQAFAYNVHGRIALKEGTEESARRAVAHFENQLKVSIELGYADDIASAKSNIALAKSKYEDGNNNEDLLKTSQDTYELRVAEFGEGNLLTIDSGAIYALNLHKANRGDEARELLTKLLVTSKQVLGSDHSTTKVVASVLSSVRQCIRQPRTF
jgi:hypothetical protein